MLLVTLGLLALDIKGERRTPEPSDDQKEIGRNPGKNPGKTTIRW
jgi:hypothetical protein